MILWRNHGGVIAHAGQACRGKTESRGLMTGADRERLLAAAARAVLAEFRKPLEKRELPVHAIAALRLLQTAVEAYSPSCDD